MTKWYKPTAENYFSRVSRQQICEVWTSESKNSFNPSLTVKKQELAEMAEKAAAKTGWLPLIFQRPEPTKVPSKRRAA
jgi:hypothetical protein